MVSKAMGRVGAALGRLGRGRKAWLWACSHDVVWGGPAVGLLSKTLFPSVYIQKEYRDISVSHQLHTDI